MWQSADSNSHIPTRIPPFRQAPALAGRSQGRWAAPAPLTSDVKVPWNLGLRVPPRRTQVEIIPVLEL